MGAERSGGIASSAKEALSARAVRVLATPALLATSMLAWIAFWTAGAPSLASSLGASLVMVAGVLFLEHATPRPGLAERPAGTIRSDVAFTAVTTVVAVVAPPLLVVPLGRAAAAALGMAPVWPASLPLWAGTVVAVLVADLTSYWWHRLQHTTGESWLWRLHSVHHSPRHFDFWMGARVHPLDVLGFTIVGYGFLAALGAPSSAIEMSAFFAAMVGAVHHTSIDTDCRWLNRVIPFADHHVVHHSILPHDAGNYGNITTLFDRLFGTYRAPTPRDCAPVGAWSLAEDFPQGAFAFQLLMPFGGFWRRATSPAAPRRDERPGRPPRERARAHHADA
jgi:sterol desaturase/sphingolipid hydroxylase (fatty acid hydroxylase superfamily)